MFHDYLAQSKLLFLPLIGLILSFLAFTAIIVRLYLAKRRGESFERMAALPLDDDASPGDAAATGRRSIR